MRSGVTLPAYPARSEPAAEWVRTGHLLALTALADADRRGLGEPLEPSEGANGSPRRLHRGRRRARTRTRTRSPLVRPRRVRNETPVASSRAARPRCYQRRRVATARGSRFAVRPSGFARPARTAGARR